LEEDLEYEYHRYTFGIFKSTVSIQPPETIFEAFMRRYLDHNRLQRGMMIGEQAWLCGVLGVELLARCVGVFLTDDTLMNDCLPDVVRAWASVCRADPRTGYELYAPFHEIIDDVLDDDLAFPDAAAIRGLLLHIGGQ
jgi:hypothetical protein